jgi:hypothetical protein
LLYLLYIKKNTPNMRRPPPIIPPRVEATITPTLDEIFSAGAGEGLLEGLEGDWIGVSEGEDGGKGIVGLSPGVI